MIKNKKLYKIGEGILLASCLISPFSLLTGLGTTFYYLTERDKLVENLQQETEVVENLETLKQQILNDYENGLISDKELVSKIEELNMPNYIIEVAKSSALSEDSQESMADVENLEKAVAAVCGVAVAVSVIGAVGVCATNKNHKSDIIEFEENDYDGENLFIC